MALVTGGRTLGEAEVAALETLANGTIHTALKHGIGRISKGVVGLDILLNGLATVKTHKVSALFSSGMSRKRHVSAKEALGLWEATYLEPLRSLSCYG